jgi:hypothetical protein
MKRLDLKTVNIFPVMLHSKMDVHVSWEYLLANGRKQVFN